MRRRSRRGLFTGAVVSCVVVGVMGISTAPATTKQGVNYAVSSHTIPSYVKLWDFLDRHFHYALLAKQITQGLRSDEERVLAIFAWTRAHIRPTPPDWTVVDDHIWHIIIRGHGAGDQMADVLTILSTYAGVPAFWTVVRAPHTRKALVVSLARIDGRWVVLDVEHGLIFRNARDKLAGMEELAADPSLVTKAAGSLQPGGIAYGEYFVNLTPPRVPKPLRAELQMVWPRLFHELGRFFTRS